VWYIITQYYIDIQISVLSNPAPTFSVGYIRHLGCGCCTTSNIPSIAYPATHHYWNMFVVKCNHPCWPWSNHRPTAVGR